MRQAILFLTNKSNEWTLRAFQALEDSMRGNADVYMLYHQHGETLPASLSELNVFPFTSSILHDMGYTPIEEGKLVPGSNHFPLLKFFKECQGYDYYWLVEDDVRFSGEWKSFFDGFSNNDADFLSSYVETKTENPDWFWWPYLDTGKESMEAERLLKSFNPIYRLSRRALTCIDEHLRNGWSGHHEALIPTLLYNKGFSIEDFGGKGSFVREGNANKFYDSASMDIKPLLPDGRKDYLFHPVKEEKVRKGKPYKKNAVFVAAGKDSLHRQLLKGDVDFDLHLLIYDGSYNKFCDDSDFICCQAGYKMDMTYHYIHRHPEFLERYEYFFLMDDDIEMPTEEVNKLFRYMRECQLKIAQPSLVRSYYTYEHTLHNPTCKLRYTNFVEMMIPCFSREALIKVLPTFKEKVRWRGIEHHWPALINTNHRDMAVIDEVMASHTHPVSFWDDIHKNLKYNYLRENHLEEKIENYERIRKMKEYIKPEQILNNLANLPQLVFEVTDACNLKCKYCAYGEFYNDFDKREDKMLPISKAIRLIDYLIPFWNSARNTSAMSFMYVSFYGGEPLLNMAFIQEIVSYFKNHVKCPHRQFLFSMTTNAILLHRYMDFLVENDFHLLISLDGNEKNDSYRVDHHGNCSFERVVHNVELLREKYPDYFDKRVNFNSVLHNRSTTEEVYRFFKERYGKIPTISELNNMGIRPDKRKEFFDTYRNSGESLHQSEHYEEIEKDMFMGASSYKSLALYLHQYSGNYYRDYADLLFDKKGLMYIPTGTCLPFSKKLFVTVNGKILPCERIGHQFGLGQVTDTGIELDAAGIAHKYNEYYNKMEKQCSRCKNHEACIQCVFNLQDLEENPVCHGFMDDRMVEVYKQNQMKFLRKHPEAYRAIMDDVVTV